MNKDITLLILSCDKFSDLWDGNIKLLEKNWHDRDMKTYIVTDLPTQKEYDNVNIISVGENVEWSDRLLAALDYVKTEYVFITFDDYFLIKKMDTDKILSLIGMMKQENLDYVRLYKHPKRATKKELDGFKNCFIIDTSCDYSVNLYSCLWKKNFLKSTIREPQNAWQFEVSLSEKAREYNARCVVSLNDEFQILDVVRKGKLLHKAVRYFKKNPGVYNGNRPVNLLSYEIKLGIQTFFSRHLPRSIYRKLKLFFVKKGKSFYSDGANTNTR